MMKWSYFISLGLFLLLTLSAANSSAPAGQQECSIKEKKQLSIIRNQASPKCLEHQNQTLKVQNASLA
jgi:hypothetical protein